MDPNNAIEVKNVYKTFKKRKNMSLKDLLTYLNFKSEKTTILKDISFDVKKGKMLGVIGKNGSGKSTTLKLLTKILRPNKGTIKTNGKVACLIELGAGFHPDMTGRENVYINASIFGIPKKIVDQRYQDIVNFADIGDYIDERVRNYSSGMYLRLAFSVAINVDADILLVDEILAVGDAAFQEKCLNKILEFKDNGGTIVLVSHNNDQVREFCDEVIWVKDGMIEKKGNPDEVCGAYDQYMKELYEQECQMLAKSDTKKDAANP